MSAFLLSPCISTCPNTLVGEGAGSVALVLDDQSESLRSLSWSEMSSLMAQPFNLIEEYWFSCSECTSSNTWHGLLSIVYFYHVNTVSLKSTPTLKS